MFHLIKKMISRTTVSVDSLAYKFPQYIVLAPDASASISYYIGPHLEAEGHLFNLVEMGADPSLDFFGAGSRVLILVRYLPPKWIPALRRFRAAGGRIVYFMDDDLMDANVHRLLPAAYRQKIRSLALSKRAVIEELCTTFWVGSLFLATKYAVWNPLVLRPRPRGDLAGKPRANFVFYHGTASHKAELEWLVQVLAMTQAVRDDFIFEVFGDSVVNKMYRSYPGVAVLHPMSWRNYLSYTNSVARDIGLAPLLPQPFNHGRGPTKFFDFARMGAVGIYTNVPPYAGFIRDGVDGILLPNDPVVWSKTITDLIRDTPRRIRMADAAGRRALELAWNYREPIEDSPQ